MEISALSRRILRELCFNSRASTTEIANKLGVSRYTVSKKVLSLERELRLRYTIEPNYAAMGLASLYVAFIKFLTKPMPNELVRIFNRSRIAQFVATTKGEFDLIVFAIAKNSIEYLKWETAMEQTLSKYGISFNPSEISTMHLGFVPIDSSVIESSDLNDVFKKILIELNENSRIGVRELSNKLGIGEDLVRYYMIKMENDGMIKRYTTIATKVPLRYNIAYFANYTIREGVQERVDNERRQMYWNEPEEFPVVNEFNLMWSTSGSSRSFTIATYNDYDEGLKRSVFLHAKIYRKDSAVLRYALIDKIIKGYLPIRNVDTKAFYNLVSWQSELI
jgi:DNA-binding Lrp family transcriptional regulator